MAFQYFVDSLKDTKLQKALRMAELKDLKAALVNSMKFEAAQQASRRDHHTIRDVDVENMDPILTMMTKILEELRDWNQSKIMPKKDC